MDKNILTSTYTENDDEKIIFSHALDIALRSESRNTVESGNFMSDSAQMRCTQMLEKAGFHNFFFWGGYDSAERVCPVFYTEYCTEKTIKSTPELAEIIFIKATLDRFNKNAALSHRDVLGSLMGLGIERDSIGDISMTEGGCVFAAKSAISSFILENLNKISRYPVALSITQGADMIKLNDCEMFNDTVASLRLDAIIAAIYNTSRSVASGAIESGLVSINGITIKKTDSSVNQGDKITYRSHGRTQLTEINGMSKKGRIRIQYLKWK